MNEQRLLQLADFLDALPEEKFNLAYTVQNLGDDDCGSVCCAVGWTPRLWPEEVQWRHDLAGPSVEHKLTGDSTACGIANELFGISISEAYGLFYPEENLNRQWGKPLSATAKPTEVAANIRAFIAWKKAQEVQS